MADIGVHLEQRVFPEAPVRHWICSLPWGLRALLGYDKSLCAEVLAAVIAELSRSLKRRAKKALALSSVKDALTGAVAAVQRVDSAVRLNFHFHIIQLDGVYLRKDAEADDGPPSFYPLPTPNRAETTRLAARIADRVEAILKKHGRSLDPHETDPDPTELQLEHPLLLPTLACQRGARSHGAPLAACYSAAALGVDVGGERAGQPTFRLVHGDGSQRSLNAPLDDEPVAEVRGINLYGKQWIDGRDRKQLERLCRYITRPPVAQERLSSRPDGTLLLEFKSLAPPSTKLGDLQVAPTPPECYSHKASLVRPVRATRTMRLRETKGEK